MEENNEEFRFSYSAPTEEERREICAIRDEYKPREKSKIEGVRMLNKKAKRTGQIVGITLGIIGVLVFGLGLTMTLEWALIVGGVCVSVCGIGLCIAAYFCSKHLIRRGKKKYRAEIMALIREILNENGRLR